MFRYVLKNLFQLFVCLLLIFQLTEFHYADAFKQQSIVGNKSSHFYKDSHNTDTYINSDFTFSRGHVESAANRPCPYQPAVFVVDCFYSEVTLFRRGESKRAAVRVKCRR